MTLVFFHRQVRSHFQRCSLGSRSNPETGRSVARYSAVGFHLKPTPIGTLRARVLPMLCLLFSLALQRAPPTFSASTASAKTPGSAKQGNPC